MWFFIGLGIVVVLVLRAIAVKKIGAPSDHSRKNANLASIPLPTGIKNAEKVRELIADGHLINAIKTVREETGIGLKEAKDYVEALRDGKIPTAPESKKPIFDDSISPDADVQALVNEGKIIEAIKFVRERTGCGLKEANDYVNRFIRHA